MQNALKTTTQINRSRKYYLFGSLHIAGGQNDNQWLQVDFGSPTRIVGVITQGRPTLASQWVISYKILYGNSTSNLVSIQNEESNGDLVSCN